MNCSRKDKVPRASIRPLYDSITDYHFIYYQGQSHRYNCNSITANADFGQRKRAVGLYLRSETNHLTPRKVVENESLRYLKNQSNNICIIFFHYH